MSRTCRRVIVAAVAVLLLLPLVPADTAGAATPRQVRETRAAAPDMRLEIDEIVVGRVDVSGWDRQEMEVVAQLGRDVTSLQIEGDRDGYQISADWEDWDAHWDDRPRRDRQHQDVDVKLEIRVPRGASVQIETVTAPVRVLDVDGRIDLETVTGPIEYGGAARVISLSTVTGRIEASGASLDRGQLETVQGDITWRGGLSTGARISFETVGGDVELSLPADVSASFDIETMTGEIDSDFGVQAERVSRWLYSRELRFSIGDGTAQVSVETLQGNVRLRRQ